MAAKSMPSSPSDEPRPGRSEVARSLLDASALLALIQGEPGAETVLDALSHGAAMSAVNVEEVAARLHHQGWSERDVAFSLGVLGVEILPLDSKTALASGALRRTTASAGCGLGDRACIATAAAQGLPVLTSDRAWLELDLPGIEVRSIR